MALRHDTRQFRNPFERIRGFIPSDNEGHQPIGQCCVAGDK